MTPLKEWWKVTYHPDLTKKVKNVLHNYPGLPYLFDTLDFLLGPAAAKLLMIRIIRSRVNPSAHPTKETIRDIAAVLPDNQRKEFLRIVLKNNFSQSDLQKISSKIDIYRLIKSGAARGT